MTPPCSKQNSFSYCSASALWNISTIIQKYVYKDLLYFLSCFISYKAVNFSSENFLSENIIILLWSQNDWSSFVLLVRIILNPVISGVTDCSLHVLTACAWIAAGFKNKTTVINVRSQAPGFWRPKWSLHPDFNLTCQTRQRRCRSFSPWTALSTLCWICLWKLKTSA